MTMTLLRKCDIPYDCSRPADVPQPGRVNIIGAGFDGTACFRKGAASGPDAIRMVSADIESYSPYLDRDLADFPFHDLGNLAIDISGNAEQDWRVLHKIFTAVLNAAAPARNRARLLTLGGEHSVSYPVIARYLADFPDLLLLHLDAHADLRDGYEGHHYSHAAVIRRCLDHFSAGHGLIQFGIRSGTREEYLWMRENRTLCNSLPQFLSMLQQVPPTRPLYLSLDLDYFDPAFLPGTGTPEAGGEDFHSFVSVIKSLQGKNLVGADVVELAPAIDPTGNSAVFAAKVVRELILTLHGEKNHGR
ncbi:MAG: agmatinase [Thermodesulfobacteriota bacterium]